MPIFNINGKHVLFIHVPKTGGTTVEKFFGAYGIVSLHDRCRRPGLQLRAGLLSKPIPLQHLHAPLLACLFDSSYFDYTFMVVRHPLQRLISEYRHSRAMRRPEALLPFSSWLRVSLAAAKLDPSFRNNHFRPQAEFRLPGTRVLYFEDGVDHCIRLVASALSLPVPADVPHERASAAITVEPTAHDIRQVERAYSSDYSAFKRYRPATPLSWSSTPIPDLPARLH